VRHLHFAFKISPFVILLTLALSQQAFAQATCLPTGFMRDGANLTAAEINPTSPYSGTLNATSCDIGIYYGPKAAGITATVDGATVYGANRFGILNDGSDVTISDSTVHDIGLNQNNGDEGYGIYFAIASGATGSITGNYIYDYGNNGIVVNGGLASNNATVNITDNTLAGQGPDPNIAQTGIQLGFGALGNISGNTVLANSYSGTAGGQGTGILVFGGPCYTSTGNWTSLTIHDITVNGNFLIGNNVGVAVFNLDSSCNTSTKASNNTISANVIRKFSVTSKTGFSVTPPAGYQAGIQDAAKGDTIENNNICGRGYGPKPTPPPYLYFIDHTLALSPTIGSNTTAHVCPSGEPPPTP
jgi:hypothetical protein